MSETHMKKEKPILFSGPMVRAIREKRKTQTRRLVKPEPKDPLAPWPNDKSCICWKGVVGDVDYYVAAGYSPYQPGDVLWVRETWCPTNHGSYEPWPRDKKAPLRNTEAFIQYRADYKGADPDYDGFWRPSIFMPRWASRITLRVTTVRAERLLDISEADAQAEGCDTWPYNPEQTLTSGERAGDSPYRSGYALLWDEINDERATWKSNPFVWVYTFEEITNATN